MDRQMQAQLQQAFQNLDPESVGALVDGSLPIAAAEMLARCFDNSWREQPEKALAIIRAVAPRVDQEARELILLSLAQRDFFGLLNRLVGDDYMIPLSDDLTNAMSRGDEQRAERLMARWAREHGVDESVFASRYLAASIPDGCYDWRRSFYEVVFEAIPDESILDDVRDGIARNRNACALKALHETGGPEVVTSLADHQFSAVVRSTRNRLFFERLFRYVNWTDEQLRATLKQAHDRGSTIIFDACYDVFGAHPIEQEILDVLFQDERARDDSATEREKQLVLMKIGAEPPEDLREPLLRATLQRPDPGALSRWLDHFSFDSVDESVESMIYEHVAKDTRLLRVVLDSSMELSENECWRIVGNLTQNSQSSVTTNRSDPLALSALLQKGIDREAVLSDVLNADMVGENYRLNLLLCLLVAGASPDQQQVNEMFRKASLNEKYSIIERLFQMGHRPDMGTYRQVLDDRKQSVGERIKALTPERVLKALRASS